MVLGFAKYSKRSSETQVSYTLKKHQRVVISWSIQNGWAFKMVVVSTGCAIAVGHAFNKSIVLSGKIIQIISHWITFDRADKFPLVRGTIGLKTYLSKYFYPCLQFLPVWNMIMTRYWVIQSDFMEPIPRTSELEDILVPTQFFLVPDKFICFYFWNLEK